MVLNSKNMLSVYRLDVLLFIKNIIKNYYFDINNNKTTKYFKTT